MAGVLPARHQIEHILRTGHHPSSAYLAPGTWVHTRYALTDTDYSMSANPNVPAYLFICVIVALFLGLSVSAEEILRDRKIRRRESFLHLSPLAYLLKIFILFLISAIQTSTFIPSAILSRYSGMGMTYSGILFAVSRFFQSPGVEYLSGVRFRRDRLHSDSVSHHSANLARQRRDCAVR